MKRTHCILAFSLIVAMAPLAQAVTISVSYQEGPDFTGTVDTHIVSSSPDTFHGSDLAAVTGYGSSQAFLRFDNIFGENPGQISANSTIDSATLTVQLDWTGPAIPQPPTTFGLHRMQIAWDENSTWNSLVDGVQKDGTDARATPDATFTPTTAGLYTIDVTSSLKAWRSGEANLGWLMEYTVFNWSGGTGFATAEYPDLSLRPLLEVDYTPNPEPSTFLPLLAVLGALSFIRRRRK